ncbi:MAG: phosphoribosylaminoimidazolesuccinocarboxamide synthase [Myxococcota bacterium]
MNTASTPERREKIHEGKAKIVYATSDPGLIIQYFKDDATAFDAKKRGTIVDKGVINNRISTFLFERLEEIGVRTHFVRKLSDREMLCRRLEIVPVEVVVRNVVAGSLAKRMGLEEGETLPRPIIEHYYKRDDLGDPPLNEEHILVFNLATREELDYIRDEAFKVNGFLVKFLDQRDIRLVDFKLEFGRARGEGAGQILLGDEISPDGCRFWDKATNEKLDKDRFRRDLGKLEETYQEVARRICDT